MARLPVDLAEKFSLFSEHWSPKVVARLNDYEIKVVKVQGEFVWHTHEDTDELFLVTSGELAIRMHDGDVVLGPGQLFVVPRGVEHCPFADGEVHAILMEPIGVITRVTPEVPLPLLTTIHWPSAVVRPRSPCRRCGVGGDCRCCGSARRRSGGSCYPARGAWRGR